MPSPSRSAPAMKNCALCWAAAAASAASDASLSVTPGSSGAASTPAGMPAATRRRIACRRLSGGVDLDEDVALELGAAIHVEGDVRRAGVAIDAGMRTPPIGIDAPAEGHGRAHAVEQSLAADLVDGRVAAHRLVGGCVCSLLLT